MGDAAEHAIGLDDRRYGCHECGGALTLHTSHEQREGASWWGYEGDEITCADCDHRMVVRIDRDDAATIGDEPACDCEGCDG